MDHDWSKYVTLSPDFTPEQRAEMVHALTFIANARDGEGMALLQAAANNFGRPIELAPSLTLTFQSEGLIGVSFQEERTFAIRQEISRRLSHVSLSSSLVHELFHVTQADRKIDTRMARNRDRVQHNPNIAEADREPVLAQMRRVLEYRIGKDNRTALSGNLASSSKPDSSEENTPATPLLHKYYLFVEAVSVLRGANGIPLDEQQAVHFTDAFMKKNSDESWRGNYRNGYTTKALRQPRQALPEFHPSPGFDQPPNIPGAMPLPTVAAVGMEPYIREAIAPAKATAEISTAALDYSKMIPSSFDIASLTMCQGVCETTRTTAHNAPMGGLSAASPRAPQ